LQRSLTQVKKEHGLISYDFINDTPGFPSFTLNKKSFDTIEWCTYEILWKFLKLLESYLSDRFQYVEIDGVKSPLLAIYKGVYQGSRLAAIFFIIYINSFFALPLHGKPFLYTDEPSLIYGAPDLITLKENMEYDLNVIKIWMDNHHLSINAKKTKY
jgi:hypothetical protein